MKTLPIVLLVCLSLAACKGPAGQAGVAGHDGAQGQSGTNGMPGTNGAPGPQGDAGAPGPPGASGQQGPAGAPGQQTTMAGSRITARYLVASDGAKTPVGWHDTTLNADCSFLTSSDGMLRCLPGTVPPMRPGGAFPTVPMPNGNVYYSDNSCTHIAFIGLYVSAQCSVPEADFALVLTSACSTYDVWAFDMPTTLPTGQFYVADGISCDPQAASGYNLFLQHVLPPSAFVSATIQ